MKRSKWLAVFSAVVMLVSLLATGVVFQASAATTGGFMTPLTTQAEVDALGTSLIAGKTAQLKTGAQFMDGYGPEYMTDGGIAALNSDASEARIQWDNFDYGKTAATVYLWFDMGSVQTVNRLLICSKMANPYQLYNGQVFVGDAVDTLFADDAKKVLSYDYGASGAWGDVNTNGREVRPIMQFSLSENCQGRYIGFAFYKPYFGDMGWTNMAQGIVVSELGVYYDPSINARASLIAGKEPVPVSTTQTHAQTQEKVTGLTVIENGANLTDGSDETGSLYLPGCYPHSDSNAHQTGQVRFYFDMGASYTVDQIDLASTGTQDKYVFNGTVYVADSPESLFADANAAASFHKGYNGNTEKRLTLSAYKTGRYVGFALYSPAAWETNWTNFWSGRVQLEELAVYGEAYVPSLIDGKTAELGAGQTNRGGEISYLTDGDTSTQFATDDGSDNNGYAQLTFTLDELTDVEGFTIVSVGDDATYYLFDGSVYVSDSKEELWNAENRVVSYNYGQGNAQRSYTYTLDESVRGKYVGFTARVDGEGWWYCARFAELKVYGTACDTPFVSKGSQLRIPDAANRYDLRFLFGLSNDGVAYAHADPVTAGNYTADIREATVTWNRETHKLLKMGAVVSNDPAAAADGLTLEEVNGGRVQDVEAKNLFRAENGMAFYTATVVRIPAAAVNQELYAVPYIVYETAEGTATAYGTMMTRTVAQLLG